MDVLRDYDNNPFVAGSTLAGAFRDYLDLRDDKRGIMGFSDHSESCGEMSRIFISDISFENELTVVTRDGVGLDENKNTITGAKFDMEAVDTGAKGEFWIETVIRDGEDPGEVEQSINTILTGIDNGDIRIGGKKTRGFGRLRVIDVRRKIFDASNIFDYRYAYDNTSYSENDILELSTNLSNKYVTIEVPLKIRGGISIRQYQAKKGEPDYKHITANGKAVVPGTSFGGAIRSRTLAVAKEVLRESGLDSKSIASIMDYLFGFVAVKQKNTAHISRISFSESIIEGGSFLNITRTAVSRFDNSVKNGALYSEKTHVGGELTLEIKVEKDVAAWAIPLILPAILDLRNGYLPIGGLVSVGRGIFEENGAVLINGEETTEDYLANYKASIEEVLRLCSI